jgi:oxalate decarboxylase
MDSHANDVGLVPQVSVPYIEVFLTLFKSSHFSEVSLDPWLRRLPVQLTEQHLRLDAAEIARIPHTNNSIFVR